MSHSRSSAAPQTAPRTETSEGSPATRDFGSNTVRAATVPAPTLRQGDRGERVRALQEAWVGLGFMTSVQMSSGPGVFGPLTRRATRSFQASRGLGPDGVYGPRTAEALSGAALPGLQQGPAPTSTEELERGDRGEPVLELQSALVSLGYLSQASMDTGPGVFGPRTEAALLAFQSVAGLRTDGVYGAASAEAVERALAGGERHAPVRDEEASVFEGGLPQPTLERGNNGSEVLALQQALVSLGHLTSSDMATGPGIFGARTKAALMSFQANNGLAADGVYGLKTAEKMAGALGVEAPTTTGAQDRGFDRSRYQDLRDGVIAAAESHLGAPYSWGGDGPSVFDCSGFVLYVLRNDMRLMNWGDDTAAGISGRLPGTSTPQKGDVVFYSGSGGITHIEFHISGTRTIGASGGGSRTYGDDPNAKVQYGDSSRDSRRKSYGSIEELLGGRS